MKNVDMTMEGNTLVIRIDCTQNFGMSSSGTSVIIASTEGNQDVPGAPGAKIGLNVYKLVRKHGNGQTYG